MTVSRSRIGNVLLLVFVIAALGGTYVVARYFRTQEENVRAEHPITFCTPLDAPPEEQTCFFTTHEHLYLTVYVFGEEQPLPFEHGNLSEHHTHSERNKLHWHKLALVPRGSQGRPASEFTLGKVLDDLGIRFTETCIFDYCNGDVHPKTGAPARLTVLVNAELITQLRDEIWHDKDRVEIRFE